MSSNPSSNSSSSALVASKEQQDEVNERILPFRHVQGRSFQHQRSANLQQPTQGEDEAFWWHRLDTLTTVAAQAPRVNSSQVKVALILAGRDVWPIYTTRGRTLAEHRLPTAPETGPELLNERANNNYLDFIKRDPRREYLQYL